MPSSKKIIVILFLSFFYFSNSAIAVTEVNKEISLQEDISHLLSFDEKILRYKVADEEAFNIEILKDIYNDRHELLIKPTKKKKSNLLIWTNSYIYNFKINFDKKTQSDVFHSFSKESKPLSGEVKDILGNLELDKPPLSPLNNYGNYNFKIDIPPGAEKYFDGR